MSTPTSEAPDLDLLLSKARTKDDLRDVVKQLHARNMRLQKVRDDLGHALHIARSELLNINRSRSAQQEPA